VGNRQVIEAAKRMICAELSADATFEVLGSPFSLLSVSLSASQILYTRRGSLVGVGGNVENVWHSPQDT